MVDNPLRIDMIRSAGVRPVAPVKPAPPRAPGAVEGASFKDTLADAIGEVQRLQTQADTTIKQLVAGEIKDVTEAMVAVEKADIAFQTMMTVRNKIVAAYEEIMRMQV